MHEVIDYGFGPSSRNRLDASHNPDASGAVAALETFYYALNNAELVVLTQIWSADAIAQLNNPVGGMLRSGEAISLLYKRIFASDADVQVTFTDAATYRTATTATFAGREIGSYRNRSGDLVDLHIRTSRFFTWHASDHRWRQVHHHGSIDSAEELSAYQQTLQP